MKPALSRLLNPKIVFAILIAAGLWHAGMGRADANPEYCAAEVSHLVPVSAMMTEKARPDTTYAFRLEAQKPRVVKVTLRLNTKDESYRAQFENILIEKTTSGVDSPILFVRFPKTVDLQYAWVDSYYLGDESVEKCPELPAEVSGLEVQPQSTKPWIKARSLAAAQFKADLAVAMVTPAVVNATFQEKRARPACAHPFEEAGFLKAAEPVTPASARRAGERGTVVVEVSLDDTGFAVGTDVIESSPFPDLDEAALSAAGASTYKPKIFDCVAIPWRYIFKATFTPDDD